MKLHPIWRRVPVVSHAEWESWLNFRQAGQRENSLADSFYGGSMPLIAELTEPQVIDMVVLEGMSEYFKTTLSQMVVHLHRGAKRKE